jgi:phosphatidylinositol alpha-1,6-mannosyltransferase
MAQIAAACTSLEREVIVVAPKVEASAAYDALLKYNVRRYLKTRNKYINLVSMACTYASALLNSHRKSTIASIWWPSGFVVSVFPRRLRGPFVVIAHGAEIMPKKLGLRRSVMRFVYRRADVVFANSSFTRGLLSEVGVVDNVMPLPLAVDSTPIIPARADTPTILSVGRLVRRKGFDRMLEAIATLSSDFPGIRYVVVGSGPQQHELARQADELGIADRVIFRGKISDDELRQTYAEAWIFALPTRRIIDDVEGFGLVYLEAAMAELPAIGGRDSGAADAIVDNETGYLVDGDNSVEIADALRSLLTRPDESAVMGRRGLERAKTFTAENTARSILRSLFA